MKQILSFLIITLTILSGSAKAQINDKQAIAMLKEFYPAYNSAWAMKGSKATVSKKLYALHDKYCTKKFSAQLRKMNILDDPLRGDDIADAAHLKGLKVTKYAGRANTYLVSYMVPVKSFDDQSFDVGVQKHIVLAKEGGKVKIAEVLFGLK